MATHCHIWLVAAKLSDEEKRVILGELDAPGANASEISRRTGVPYRTLMRLKSDRAKDALPKQPEAPEARPEPRVIVVTGDVLAMARTGLEAGIGYLANVATRMNPDHATPADIRAVGGSVVKVLATVVELLGDHNPGDAPNSLVTLSDEELIAEAKRIAMERTKLGHVN